MIMCALYVHYGTLVDKNGWLTTATGWLWKCYSIFKNAAKAYTQKKRKRLSFWRASLPDPRPGTSPLDPTGGNAPSPPYRFALRAHNNNSPFHSLDDCASESFPGPTSGWGKCSAVGMASSGDGGLLPLLPPFYQEVVDFVRRPCIAVQFSLRSFKLGLGGFAACIANWYIVI